LLHQSKAEIGAKRQTAKFELLEELIVIALLVGEVTIVEPDVAPAESIANASCQVEVELPPPISAL